MSVALAIEHSQRMRSTVLSVACRSRHFSTLSHKPHDCRGKIVVEHKNVFWFSLQLLSKPFCLLRRTEG